MKPCLLEGTLHRVVESQQQVATNLLCDTLEDTDVLENMLDRLSKPKIIPGTESLHYLLASPWRYPPLKYGTRFGATTERSLFYASKSDQTCLAESAFYRLKFFHDMRELLPQLRSRHTLFEAKYRTASGLELQQKPFSEFAEILSHKTGYGPCQQLGAELRAAGIEAVEFTSARDPERGVNVALFTPAALVSKKPGHTSKWFCLTTADGVSFSREGRPGKIVSFQATDFYHNGGLPKPAQ